MQLLGKRSLPATSSTNTKAFSVICLSCINESGKITAVFREGNIKLLSEHLEWHLAVFKVSLRVFFPQREWITIVSALLVILYPQQGLFQTQPASENHLVTSHTLWISHTVLFSPHPQTACQPSENSRNWNSVPVLDVFLDPRETGMRSHRGSQEWPAPFQKCSCQALTDQRLLLQDLFLLFKMSN